jgi:hypothetical protein
LLVNPQFDNCRIGVSYEQPHEVGSLAITGGRVNLQNDGILLDIGDSTGSLAIRGLESRGRNAILRSPQGDDGKIYAIDETVDIIRGRCAHDGVENGDLAWCDPVMSSTNPWKRPILGISLDLRDGSGFANMHQMFVAKKPQIHLQKDNYLNVVERGVQNDGRGDQSAKINQLLKEAASQGIAAFFPPGMYAVANTVFVPKGSRIIGQLWPQIMGYGAVFNDEYDPQAVVQ